MKGNNVGMLMINKVKIGLVILLALLLVFSSCTFDENPTKPNVPTDESRPHSPSPADGAINQENLLNLQWEFDADSFYVYLDTNNPPQALYKRIGPTNSLVVYAPGKSKTFYWKIVAKYKNGTRIEGPVWMFTTKTDAAVPLGYVMKKYSLSTEPPNLVKILFQVLDLEEKGVDNLVRDDFEIYEDGYKISPRESELYITKSEENEYKFKTVLMLDNSTSLTGENTGNLELMKTAAKNFVNNMHDKQVIAVYEFSGTVNQLIGFTPKSRRQDLLFAINGIQKGAMSTDLYGAVITGASKLTQHFSADSIVQSAMVLFTDGDDTQGSHTLGSAVDAVQNKLVYTVGLGPDINPDVLEILGTGGYFLINESSELNQIFLDIQYELSKLANSFYWMEYQSPKRGNSEHLLQLRIINNPINSFIEGTFKSTGFFDPQPGIYFNTSFVNPQGEDEIFLLSGGDPVEIFVRTFGGDKEPFYSWSDDSLLIRNNLNANRSHVSIKAKENITSDTTVILQVNDAVNGFTKDLKFTIFKP